MPWISKRKTRYGNMSIDMLRSSALSECKFLRTVVVHYYLNTYITADNLTSWSKSDIAQAIFGNRFTSYVRRNYENMYNVYKDNPKFREEYESLVSFVGKIPIHDKLRLIE